MKKKIKNDMIIFLKEIKMVLANEGFFSLMMCLNKNDIYIYKDMKVLINSYLNSDIPQIIHSYLGPYSKSYSQKEKYKTISDKYNNLKDINRYFYINMDSFIIKHYLKKPSLTYLKKPYDSLLFISENILYMYAYQDKKFSGSKENFHEFDICDVKFVSMGILHIACIKNDGSVWIKYGHKPFQKVHLDEPVTDLVCSDWAFSANLEEMSWLI